MEVCCCVVDPRVQVGGTHGFRLDSLLLLLLSAIVSPNNTTVTTHHLFNHSSLHATTQISVVHKPQDTTHPHASSLPHKPISSDNQSTPDHHLTCSDSREQNSQTHASEHDEDRNAKGGAKVVEDEAEGLVGLQEVVHEEDEGEGVGDDAEEHEEGGEDGREHCCRKVERVAMDELMLS